MTSHPDVERTGTCATCGQLIEWVPLSMGGWGVPQEQPGIGTHGWSMVCHTQRTRTGRVEVHHAPRGESPREIRWPRP